MMWSSALTLLATFQLGLAIAWGLQWAASRWL